MSSRSSSDNEDVEARVPLLNMSTLSSPISNRTPTASARKMTRMTSKGELNRPEQARFSVIANDGIMLREGPGTKAKRNGSALRQGEVFAVTSIVTIAAHGGFEYWTDLPEDLCFMELSDGRGWVMDRCVGTMKPVVERHDPDMDGMDLIRYRLRKAFLSSKYEYTIVAIIIVNAATIGLEIDHQHMASDLQWLTVNSIFAAIYVSEMGLKLFAFPANEFFRSYWNMFDLLVTAVTFAGDCYMIGNLHRHGSSHDSSFFAIVPVIRLLRLLRIANLFGEMRVLLHAFLGSVAGLLSIALFTMLWFYVCACLCTVFLGREEMLRDNDIPDAAKLRARFATIGTSMYTLFEVMILEGWTDVVRPLVAHKLGFVLFFLLFVFVTAFFLMNLVTAVVVDHTMQAKDEREKTDGNVAEDARESRVHAFYQAMLLLNGGEDTITREHLNVFAKKAAVMQCLHELDFNEPLDLVWFLVDHNSKGTSLKAIRNVMTSFGQTLDTSTFLRTQAQMARRVEDVLDQQAQLLQKLESSSRV